MKVFCIQNNPVSKSYLKKGINTNLPIAFKASENKANNGKNNNKKLAAYILGGLAVGAGLIFGIRKLNASKITKAASDAVQNVDWHLTKKELAEITVNPSKKFKIRIPTDHGFVEDNSVNAVVDKIINAINPNSEIDRGLAREVLPNLIKHSEEMQIGGQYERFLRSIDAENKDFAMGSVVPWLSKHYKNMGLRDAYNNNNFMDMITPDNIKQATRLAEQSKELGLTHHSQFEQMLGIIYESGEGFIFDEAIPTFLKHKDKLPEPDGTSVVRLFRMLTPKNIRRVFEEDVPAVLENKEKLKIEFTRHVVSSIEAIEKLGKDSFFNEILPFLNKNEQALKIGDGSEYAYLVSKIKPENKDKLKWIIENLSSLKIKSGYSAADILSDSKGNITQAVAQATP